MGDQEFEDYLNNGGDEDYEGGVPECQKNLLLNIIGQKMGNSTQLIDVLSKLYLKAPKANILEYINELMVTSREAFDQLDYLMSIVLEEIDGEDDFDSGDIIPPTANPN
jgi:hypothetical protein